MKRLKYKYKPKYPYGGTMTAQQNADSINKVNTGLSMVPVYGQIYAGAHALSGAGQRALDGSSMANTNVGNAGSELMEASHENAIREFKSGSIGGGIRDIFGVGTGLRTIGDLSGHQNDISGFWGGFNKLSGQTKKNQDNQNNIDAQNEYNAQQASDEAARKQAELDAENKYKATQQDNYNKAYYSANPELKNPTGSIYAKYGGKLYGNGGTIPNNYKVQHGSFNKVNDKDLHNVWNQYPENKGKPYYSKFEQTNVNGKPYYNYYLYGNNPDNIQQNDTQQNINTPNIAPSNTVDPMKEIGYNGMLAPITEQYGGGGSIHIKPSHKGRFTAYKERTGKTTEEALHSSDPHVRQMANFARNAAKWHHGDGGELPVEEYSNGGNLYTITPKRQSIISYNRGNGRRRYYRHGDGGELNPLASDTVKAVGDTHEEGGITLQANGKPFAEVEDQEIIQDNNVFSDRLKLGNKTYAEIAENLAKKKGKFEKLGDSTSYRDKNTSERSIKNIDAKLDNLFNIQEASKIPVINRKFGGGGNLEDDELLNNFSNFQANYQNPDNKLSNDFSNFQANYQNPDNKLSNDFLNNMGSKRTLPPIQDESKGTYKSNNFGKYAQMAIPFIDNAYNSYLINQTPQIPMYNKRVAYSSTAMPMRTNYNVDNQIGSINDASRNFQANIDNTTANSAAARGNKNAAFADTLRAKNDVYANKENMENNMINQNNQNIQNVGIQNTRNKQDVDNQNLALLDQYNMANTMRADNILRNKSTNVSNAVGDAQRLAQDYNMHSNDEERIMTDSLRYNDGAGMARLIGSKTMNNMVSNPTYYKQIEAGLQNQPLKLQQFYQMYGKR